ncbi:MAG: hypothetical protein ACQERB_10475 [Promethearchaeati archaeon]
MSENQQIEQFKELIEYYQKRLEIQKLRLKKQHDLRKNAEKLFHKNLEKEYQLFLNHIHSKINNHKQEINKIKHEMNQLKS